MYLIFSSGDYNPDNNLSLIKSNLKREIFPIHSDTILVKSYSVDPALCPAYSKRKAIIYFNELSLILAED